MQLNDFKTSIVREIKSYFAKGVIDFEVKLLADEPVRNMEIEFTIYGYFVVKMQIERNTVFFGIKEGDICIRIHKAPLQNVNNEPAEFLGLSNLQKLDDEIKLRIPDKYLKEKGWY